MTMWLPEEESKMSREVCEAMCTADDVAFEASMQRLLMLPEDTRNWLAECLQRGKLINA